MEAVGFWSAVCHLVTGPLTSPRFGALYLVLSLVVLVLPGFRLTRLGFELTETDLRIFQFFRTRTVGRDTSRRVRNPFYRGNQRSAVSILPSEIRLLPVGEGLVIPANEVAEPLNQLYGLRQQDLPVR